MRITLIGANGQLGTELLRVLSEAGNQISPVLHSTFDVCSPSQVEDLVGNGRPDVVVNTAAFHKVEECEKHPDHAFEVNAIGALNLARTCHRHGAALVHFSTDYVFDGSKGKPYEEADPPAPANVYGASKVAGEQLITCNTDRFLIIRTCGLYGHVGSRGKGGNFVDTMLKKAAERGRIRVVNDQILTPTSTADLAQVVRRLIDTGAFGLYHASCEGACSWYDFACQIFALLDLEVDLVPVTTRDLASPVRRPAYSVLSKTRLRSLGLSMPVWEASLDRYLQERKQKHETFSAAPH